ncbi:hypothetical protein D1115_10545 [Vibrio alfacsensis]|uniref:DUF645 family protein n=1 Tax=Vibrio alfacsensis TaxID=1074311 RepID=A0ABM6YV79_9VIBR|nr:hypothetical protein D1115_10545 [Vibrio alfacsensis]
MLKSCFPNTTLKCGANHSKLDQAVKRFSCVFTPNAAFLGKDDRNSPFCLGSEQFVTKFLVDNYLFEFTLLDVTDDMS